jgi:hypothetical protein
MTPRNGALRSGDPILSPTSGRTAMTNCGTVSGWFPTPIDGDLGDGL